MLMAVGGGRLKDHQVILSTSLKHTLPANLQHYMQLAVYVHATDSSNFVRAHNFQLRTKLLVSRAGRSAPATQVNDVFRIC